MRSLPMWEIFGWIGLIVSTCAMFAAVGFAALVVAVYVQAYFPRFHIGRPKSNGELCFYSRTGIITGKNGCKELAPVERGDLIQGLNLLWWVGMSSRNSARWFFGFMRWKSTSNGL